MACPEPVSTETSFEFNKDLHTCLKRETMLQNGEIISNVPESVAVSTCCTELGPPNDNPDFGCVVPEMTTVWDSDEEICYDAMIE